jgi:hypothetical protein
MITCLYCSHKNEDGTLFCERCKSDLVTTSEKAMSELSSAPATVPVHDIPMAEPFLPDTSSYDALDEAIKNTEPVAADTSSYQVKPLPPTPGTSRDPVSLPTLATPKLVVIRGQKLNIEYPIYTGDNFIGRTDEKPVDIDLEDQESAERIWCSRQHARVIFDDKGLSIEDLGSQNGTFVNRARIFPGQIRPLESGDVVQIGTVQMKLKLQ